MGHVFALTFSVLENPLDKNGIFGDPLSDQQNALWNTEPAHNAAAHCLLHGRKDTQRPSHIKIRRSDWLTC